MHDKIFISHAAKDKKLVEELTNLLILGVGVNTNQIFCSSIEGMDLPKGKNFIDVIQEEIKNPKLVVLVLTPNYFESIFCVCELGASWVLSHSCHPIIVPPLSYENMKAVLTGVQAGTIDKSADLDSLRDDTVKLLGITNPVKTSRWNINKDQFLKKLPTILSEMTSPNKIDRSVYDELMEKYESSLTMLDEKELAIKELQELVDKLKLIKNKEEVLQVIMDSSSDIEQFEMLVSESYKNMKELPNIVVEALYYSYSNRDFQPDPHDRDKWERIKSASEDGFLDDSDESGIVTLNVHDPKIREAIKSINKLEKFLSGEASVDFYEDYLDKHEYEAKLSSRRFWNDQFYL